MHDKLSNVVVADPAVEIDRGDLIEAWSLLENLTVSFDQLGGALDTEEELRQALRDYITPDLVAALNRARMRLGRYLPDEEAESMSEHDISYWDYKGMVKGKYVGVAKE